MAKKRSTPDTPEDPKDVITTPDEIAPDQPDDTNWEDRFKGLQRTFDKAQKKLTALQEKEETLQEEAETTKQAERDKQTALEALQKEQATTKAELDRLTGELATQEASGLRAQVIMKDFSDLAQFEVDGLLPEAETEEEMVKKFTAFRASVQKLIKANVEQQIVGTAPTDSGTTVTTPVRTKAEIYAQLQALAGNRDPDKRAEYKQLLAEWDEANEK